MNVKKGKLFSWYAAVIFLAVAYLPALAATSTANGADQPRSAYFPLLIPQHKVWLAADEGDVRALFEKGIRLGGGFGCNKAPAQALEAMQASASLGYGPAALVCAMAEEIKAGWIVVGGSATSGMVTPAKRLYAYIGTANIGGWYDMHVECQFSSRSGEGLDSDAVVARIRSMYRRAKELGAGLAEDELERFNATVARQREIVAKMRQKQEDEERRRLREIKAEESRRPLVRAAEPGWKASFAGCVIGQTYPPDSQSGVVYGGIVKAYRPRKKLEVPSYGMDTLQLSLTPTSHRIFRIFADRGFTGDRESFLSEGRAFLKNIGAMMGVELAPFKFEAPNGSYWPKCNLSGLSGPVPKVYFADESQWFTSKHVFAFSHTKKGSVHINVRLGILHDKPSYFYILISDSELEHAADTEFDAAFRATHNGKSYDEWSKDVASRHSLESKENGGSVSRKSSGDVLRPEGNKGSREGLPHRWNRGCGVVDGSVR